MRRTHHDPHPNAVAVSGFLKMAFKALRKLGYECHSNWKCCQNCGCAALKNCDKYVFYHKQDADSLREDGTVYLAWSGDGNEIKEALRQVNLNVEWDGTEGTRLLVRL